MSDVGFYGIEFNSLALKFESCTFADLEVKVDVSVARSEEFTWQSNSLKSISTANLQCFREESTEEGEERAKVSFRVGFNSWYQRSTYVELNPDVLNRLANAFLVVRISRLDSNPAPVAAAAPAKGKGAPAAAPSGPSEDLLVECTLPFSSLLCAKGGVLSFNSKLNDPKFQEWGVKIQSPKENLSLAASSLDWKVFCDNDLSEYVLGSSILQWRAAELSCPPVDWALHYKDFVDPKAKAKPTPEEFRAKYIENITKLIENQEKAAAYSLQIFSPAALVASGEESTGNKAIPVLPKMELGRGVVSFNSEGGKAVSIEEEIRDRLELWKITWGPSNIQFLHRSQVRTLLSALQSSSPEDQSVTFLATKTVLPEAKASEGEDQAFGAVGASVTDSTFFINLSNCGTPGQSLTDFELSFPSASRLKLTMSISPPLIPKPADSAAPSATSTRPADVVSGSQVSTNNRNRDVMRELREEIRDVVKTVAEEYVRLYPAPLASDGTAMPTTPGTSADGAGPGLTVAVNAPPGSAQQQPMTGAERKAEFMHYLSVSGTYHTFKEQLKPKIQRVVRERFGARGQALGKGGREAEQSLEAILSELYVYLVKECNVVLNSMYSNTIIDRDATELERGPLIDDEVETPGQAFSRLLGQAEDAESSSRVKAAEQYHLERLQLLSSESILGSEPASVHEAYSKIAEFYLRLAADRSLLAINDPSGNKTEGLSVASQYFGRARQALEVASTACPMIWQSLLALACCLVEANQKEMAEPAFLASIQCQLSGLSSKSRSDKNSLNNLEDFDGYDSDKLCPVEPLCYAVLAGYFHTLGLALKTRKALVLANRSYIEGGYYPPVSSHGSPRRTIVLCLCQAAEYCFTNSFFSLGQACVQLAQSCDESVTAKAISRSLPANTVPFVKHFLKRVMSMSLLAPQISLPQLFEEQQPHHVFGNAADPARLRPQSLRQQDALQAAQDSVQSSADPKDAISGWTAVGKVHAIIGSPPVKVYESYRRALNVAAEHKDLQVSAKVLLSACDLMIRAKKYEDALSFLMPACKIYSTSSALLLLIGVACLKLQRMEDAEDALLEANLLDNRNPDVWAYLSIFCLACGSHRAEEAEKSMQQAIRLGISSSELLVDLASAFYAVDKLLIAEDLVRRSLAVEEASSGAAANVHSMAATRKFLGDILANQNQSLRAFEEYSSVLKDRRLDPKVRLEAGEGGVAALTVLGRKDEIAAVRRMMDEITAQANLNSRL